MLKIRFKNKKDSAVWLVEPKVTIGRARDNLVVVNAPEVADYHLEILVQRDDLNLVNLVPEVPVNVNGEPMTGRRALFAGDTLTLAGIALEIIDPKDDLPTKTPVKRPAQTSARNSRTTGWALKANHSVLKNKVYPLKSRNVIGRSSDCDICLAAAHLSRRHAELTVTEDGVLYIKDLGSANGTYLNGKRIAEARIKRGDELRFDTLSFGVIGPADDLAKTFVRTAGAGPSGGARKRANEDRHLKTYTPPVQPQAPSSQGPRYATGGLIVLVLLAVVVVGALVLTRG